MSINFLRHSPTVIDNAKMLAELMSQKRLISSTTSDQLALTLDRLQNLQRLGVDLPASEQISLDYLVRNALTKPHQRWFHEVNQGVQGIYSLNNSHPTMRYLTLHSQVKPYEGEGGRKNVLRTTQEFSQPKNGGPWVPIRFKIHSTAGRARLTSVEQIGAKLTDTDQQLAPNAYRAIVRYQRPGRQDLVSFQTTPNNSGDSWQALLAFSRYRKGQEPKKALLNVPENISG